MTPISNERDALLGNTIDVRNEGNFDESDDDAEHQHREFVALKDRAWSFGQSRLRVATTATTSSMPSSQQPLTETRRSKESAEVKTTKEEPQAFNAGQHYLFCFIYAVVNVIIAVPGLFGYAAVIFNHPIYANHMNALSKCKQTFVSVLFRPIDTRF